MIIIILGFQNTFRDAAALFSVDVPQSSYIVHLGSSVDMECRFPVNSPLNLEELMITWLHSAPPQSDQQEVYVLHKGKKDLANQNTDFTGRAALLEEKLYGGAAVLTLTNVTCSDNGTYVCLIGYRGADYKYIDLKVAASYAKISTHSELAEGGGELVLTCSAEGFPMAEVYWQEGGANISVQSNTSYTLTTNGLYQVTSTLRARLEPENNYRCLFWNKELQNTTSEELFPPAHRDAAVAEPPPSLYYILVPFVTLLGIIGVCAVAFFIKKRCRKEYHKGEEAHLQMKQKSDSPGLALYERLFPVTSTKRATVGKWHRNSNHVDSRVSKGHRVTGDQELMPESKMCHQHTCPSHDTPTVVQV